MENVFNPTWGEVTNNYFIISGDFKTKQLIQNIEYEMNKMNIKKNFMIIDNKLNNSYQYSILLNINYYSDISTLGFNNLGLFVIGRKQKELWERSFSGGNSIDKYKIIYSNGFKSIEQFFRSN